jgi:hypothetical protein
MEDIVKNRTKAILLLPVIALMVGAATAPAAASRRADPAVEEVDQALDEPGQGVTGCTGGVQEAALVRMNDTPTNLVENAAFANLTGSAITFNTPANDSDQVLVIFSAEARLFGQPDLGYVAPADFLQIQVLLDGVPMPPLNDLLFTSDAGQSNAAQACLRLPVLDVAANHTVRVQWLLVDQFNDSVLTGTLDDWVLHVEINN